MIVLVAMYLGSSAPCCEVYTMGEGDSLSVGLSGDWLGLHRSDGYAVVWAGEPSEVQAVFAEFVQGLRAGKSVIALNLRSLGRADVAI